MTNLAEQLLRKIIQRPDGHGYVSLGPKDLCLDLTIDITEEEYILIDSLMDEG